jgi:hypothetical protein
MATVVKIGSLATVLEQRIAARLAFLSPNDPKIAAVLTKIGIMVERQAKIHIRRNHLIDTGTLFNSVKYKLLGQQGGQSTVEIGSYGVPYAAAHEFGFSGLVGVRSFTRNQTTAFGRAIPAKPVTVAAHTRAMYVRKRPYLKPALADTREKIIDLVRSLYGGGA